MDRQQKIDELAELRSRAEQIERELAVEANSKDDSLWRTKSYYGEYYATVGFLLGMIPAVVSLLCNIVGSVLFKRDQHPLQLIRVFLTFPMGEKALNINDGLALTIGCSLYVFTGMVYGMVFQLFFTRFFPQVNLAQRIVIGVMFGLALWFVNFYLILSWLQPALFGGRWIVEEIPFWVALLTHAIFGLFMAIVSPLGKFVPYRASAKEFRE